MEVILLSKNNFKLHVACDGSAASGKTTGAKLISKKYNLKFLSSGLLYRYAAYIILKNKTSKTEFLQNKFKFLNYKSLNKINLHNEKISNYAAIIAKRPSIRKVLKKFQINFAKKNKRICIEGRDIGSVILPNADVKYFFKCGLNIAAKRRIKELKKKNKNITLNMVKKSLKLRNLSDTKRKNSPLLKTADAVLIDTGKTKSIKDMLRKMSIVLEKKFKNYDFE